MFLTFSNSTTSSDSVAASTFSFTTSDSVVLKAVSSTKTFQVDKIDSLERSFQITVKDQPLTTLVLAILNCRCHHGNLHAWSHYYQSQWKLRTMILTQNSERATVAANATEQVDYKGVTFFPIPPASKG